MAVQEKGAFKLVLQKLVIDQGFYNELVRLQSEICQKWGTLDGKSADRVFRLIDKLILQA